MNGSPLLLVVVSDGEGEGGGSKAGVVWVSIS
jgi:hypothetical protein